MSKKFKNKKLNKADHAKVDKEADITRVVVKSAIIVAVIKTVSWKKVGETINKMIFRG